MRRSSRAQRVASPELVEIVTPRTNAAVITPAENLFAAISLPEPFSFEIVGTHGARWFLARAGSAAMRRHLAAQLAVAYPQAELRRLETDRYPGLDPAWTRSEEQVAACSLVLRAPPYLPLRTFQDSEVEAGHNAQADPVLGILGALDDLPENWRGLVQLVLQPAPDDWCRDYLRLAVEHPLASERTAGRADTSLTQVFGLAGLLVVGALAFQGHSWYVEHDWGHLAELLCGSLFGVPSAIWVLRRLGKRPIYDMRLVTEKVSRIAYHAQVRLAVFAPKDVSRGDVEARLQQLVAAYRQFNLASGNGLLSRPLDLRRWDLRALRPLPGARSAVVLNTRELAGLWHLPQAGATVPLLERTTARRLLPLPVAVANGCRIGVSSHQGRTVPVSLPDELLRRHLLLVAKTRRGKSSLLLRLARHGMEPHSSLERQGAVVLIDPHHDLARAALGLVPQSRRDDVVYLDVSQRERPFGLNLLDTGLGWDRDKAVSNALSVFHREFDQYWGPRMEDSFRFALLALFEANEAICAKGRFGRSQQYTILDVPALFVYPGFRKTVLDLVSDAVIRAWWSDYFERLDSRLKIEIVNPVQTKCQKYAGSYAARGIVGQPCSTVAPLDWLRSGAIVIVNTAKGTVGEGTAALVGATLLNLIALGVAEQAALDPDQRVSATLMVDEFHTLPGADYEGILTELAKYGASLVLATQSLATLEALDRERDRALRARVFANLDGLFAFHTSAEDARYLVPELGEEIDVQDLVGLGEHQCYVKVSLAGERLSTFSVRLDPPPQSDPDLGKQLALTSAAKYGRERAAVERDLRSARARIELSHARLPQAVERADKPSADKSIGEKQAEQATGKRKQRSKKSGAGEAISQQPLFDTKTGVGPVNEAELVPEDDEPNLTGEGELVE